MPRWLKKLLCEALGRLTTWSPRSFAFFDGRGLRRIRPNRAAWILDAKFPRPFNVDDAEQLGRATRVVREAFNVKPLNAATGEGLTDAEIARLWVQFMEYVAWCTDPRRWWNHVPWVRTDGESTP